MQAAGGENATLQHMIQDYEKKIIKKYSGHLRIKNAFIIAINTQEPDPENGTD